MTNPKPMQGLAPEWQRIQQLLTLTESLRYGGKVAESFAADFDALSRQVTDLRDSGAWRFLADQLGLAAEPANHLDLDILVLSLAPDVSPALGPRIQALQPQVRSPYPSLPLLQDVLMLDDPAVGEELCSRLTTDKPLTASGLICIEREGDYQIVRPAAGVANLVLGRSHLLGPPQGAHLVLQKTALSEVVLPPQVAQQLKELIQWVRFRPSIIRTWGASPQPGPLVLFSGGSGVGKTLAAAAIATELGWPLYSLDLGAIISKYVGETEQNMNRLLDAMHGRQAVLQIDEAEGLIGKRGEITDARDRYANLEVSHLLARFERHDGPVILTTNLKANLDTAFFRRFQFIVDFPSPNAEARRALWRLTLPPHAPLSPDVDIELIGDDIAMSGGGIRNAAFHAAVMASANGEAIAGRHIALAIWRELSKENRVVPRQELGRVAAFLPQEIVA